MRIVTIPCSAARGDLRCRKTWNGLSLEDAERTPARHGTPLCILALAGRRKTTCPTASGRGGVNAVNERELPPLHPVEPTVAECPDQFVTVVLKAAKLREEAQTNHEGTRFQSQPPWLQVATSCVP